MACGQPRVFGALGTSPYRPRYLDHPFASQPLGNGMGIGGQLGIEDDLDYTLAVAQVDEYETAVIAPAVHPAR